MGWRMWAAVAGVVSAAVVLETAEVVAVLEDFLPWVASAIEPIDGYLDVPDATLIQQRGPFDPDDEFDLLRREGIEVLVSKNSGGDATAAKLVAARRLGLPVVMVSRPPKPDVESVAHIDQVLPWLVAQGLFATERGV